MIKGQRSFFLGSPLLLLESFLEFKKITDVVTFLLMQQARARAAAANSFLINCQIDLVSRKNKNIQTDTRPVLMS